MKNFYIKKQAKQGGEEITKRGCRTVYLFIYLSLWHPCRSTGWPWQRYFPFFVFKNPISSQSLLHWSTFLGTPLYWSRSTSLVVSLWSPFNSSTLASHTLHSHTHSYSSHTHTISWVPHFTHSATLQATHSLHLYTNIIICIFLPFSVPSTHNTCIPSVAHVDWS